MARKQSSQKLSKLAAETLNDPAATDREKSLAASVLSQDETTGDPAEEALANDPERAERARLTQERLKGRTRDLAAGKVRKRARVGETK